MKGASPRSSAAYCGEGLSPENYVRQVFPGPTNKGHARPLPAKTYHLNHGSQRLSGSRFFVSDRYAQACPSLVNKPRVQVSRLVPTNKSKDWPGTQTLLTKVRTGQSRLIKVRTAQGPLSKTQRRARKPPHHDKVGPIEGEGVTYINMYRVSRMIQYYKTTYKILK